MALPRIGHFGLPAIILAVLPIIALTIHLSAPFVILDDGDDSQSYSAGEVASDFDDGEVGPAATPNLILAGLIVATIGGVALLVANFVPLPKEPMRWLGWSLTAIALVGMAMAFHTAMLWTGSGFGHPHPEVFEGGEAMMGGQTMDFGPMMGGQQFTFTTPFFFWSLTGGFTGLLETTVNTDHGVTAWVVSPAVTAFLALGGLITGLVAMGRLITTRDEARHNAGRHLGVAVLGLGLIFVTLLVPWSIGYLTDDTGDDTDAFFFGARTIMVADDASDGDSFSGLAYTIRVLLATGWTAFAAGVLGTVGGMIRSLGVSRDNARHVDWVGVPVAALLLWSVLSYLLHWTYQWRPYSGADGWQPGWFPLLVLPILGLLVWQVVGVVSNLRVPAATVSGDGFHSFD